MLAACWAFYSRAFCSWLLVPRCCAWLLARLFILGRFVPGSSFLGVVLAACWAFCSWILVLGYCACYLLGVLLLVPGVLFLDPRSVLDVGAPGVTGS